MLEGQIIQFIQTSDRRIEYWYVSFHVSFNEQIEESPIAREPYSITCILKFNQEIIKITTHMIEKEEKIHPIQIEISNGRK